MALADTLLTMQSSTKTEVKSMNIIEFATSKFGLNLKLYPAQRFILKLFYGLPLLTEVEIEDPIIIRDQFNEKVLHTFSEKEFLDFLYLEKRININYEQYLKRDKVYNEAIFAIGRRGSKTVMSSIITLYTLYLLMRLPDPHDYFRVMASDYIGIAIASNGQISAMRQYDAISSMINNSPFFKRYMVSDNGKDIILDTRKSSELKSQGKYIDGNQIKISAFAVSPAVRGASNAVVILDEFGHYVDSQVKMKDKPLDEFMYEALTPSISGFTTPDGKSFGKKFIISSPNGPKGMLYRMVQEAHQYNENSLAINTPSHWINLRVSGDEIKSLWNKSEISCRQEYGGEFVTKISDWIKNPDKLWACVDKSNINKLPSSKIQNNQKYFLGIDLGLSGDNAAFAVAHYELERPSQMFIKDEYKTLVSEGECFVVDYVKQIEPDEITGVIDSEEIIKEIRLILSRFPIAIGCYDQWSGELWTQTFNQYGFKQLQQLNSTQQSNSDMAMNFKQLVSEGKLILPDYSELMNELFALKETAGRNGLIKVENTEDHDDRYDAISRALFLCMQNKLKGGSIKITTERALINPNRNVYETDSVSGLNRQPYRRSRPINALDRRRRHYGV